MHPLLRPDYILEYALARLFLMAAQALPLEAALELGHWSGRAMAGLTRSKFRQGVDNIMASFPGLTRAGAETTMERVYEHFGRTAVEVAVAHRLLRDSTCREHLVVRNEHYAREAIEAGKGAIFVSAHLGVWEVFGILLRSWGIRPASVYRPVKNPYVDRMVRQLRSSFGQVMVEREGALLPLMRALRRGGCVALLADQHAKRDGTWVPFFGRLASTTPGPALLALRTGAPIITGYARRAAGSYNFEVFFDKPIYATPTADRKGDVTRVTAEIARRTEEYVRQYPEQWLWMHRRWRTPPREIAQASCLP